MGCLKLDISKVKSSPLKVVYRKSESEKKGVQRFTRVDPLAEKYPGLSPYLYVANNPLNYIDPDGRIIVPVHGTWAKPSTWNDLAGISLATDQLFGDYQLGNSFRWTGGNYAEARTKAAGRLIAHVRKELKDSGSKELTLVGHSHGGNVSIEAINMMAEMEEFDDVEINLLSINTPVREDYQLSEKASERVNHVNVYDPKDPVQANGGKSMIVLPERTNSVKKGTGEFGKAGRRFKGAMNMSASNPQGILGEWHNSHNRVSDWMCKEFWQAILNQEIK